MKLAGEAQAQLIKVAAIGIGGALLLYVGYRLVKGAASAAVTAVADAAPLVNPVDRRNLAYSGVNAVGSAVTGEGDFSLGSKIYDWLHPNEGI